MRLKHVGLTVDNIYYGYATAILSKIEDTGHTPGMTLDLVPGSSGRVIRRNVLPYTVAYPAWTVRFYGFFGSRDVNETVIEVESETGDRKT
jgi:hypothetical protein